MYIFHLARQPLYFAPIATVLADGQAHSIYEIYGAVELNIDPCRRMEKAEDGTLKWRFNCRLAILKMRSRGWLAHSAHRYWRLTPAGKQALESGAMNAIDEPPATQQGLFQ